MVRQAELVPRTLRTSTAGILPPPPLRFIRLDPKLDVVFKLLLTRRPELLRHMLEGILGKPIREVIVLNPGIPGQVASDKEIVLDIRVMLDDGSRADVEMQLRITPALPSRLVYYGARDYAGQLDRGDGYDRLTPTVVVVWLREPLFPGLDRRHAIFELRERHTQFLFGDQLTIHLLQLSGSSSPPQTRYDVIVDRWARFFNAYDDDAVLDQLAAEDPMMSLAKQTLDELSQDPATRRLAREREDAIKLYRLDLLAAGRESEAKGKAELLLKLLTMRFGPVPEHTRALVQAASPEQIEAWAERMLTATSLDEVLAS